MLINFSMVLHDFKNVSLKDADGEDFTLGKLCHAALLNDPTPALSGDQKYKRYELAKKVFGQCESEISIDELALLKDTIGKVWQPMIYGLAIDALEGKN